MAWIILPLANIVSLPLLGQSLVIFLVALEAPICTLILATFSENKVAGLALMSCLPTALKSNT